jgi:hypothetical protein
MLGLPEVTWEGKDKGQQELSTSNLKVQRTLADFFQ